MAVINDGGSKPKHTTTTTTNKPQNTTTANNTSKPQNTSGNTNKSPIDETGERNSYQRRYDTTELSPAAKAALEKDSNTNNTDGTSTTRTTDPSAIHINQFDGDPNGSNADCGPTSLAMALRGVGLNPPGTNENSSAVDTVASSRRAMYTDGQGNSLNEAKDGVDANGNRVDSEHGTYTTLDAIQRGAENSGATATRVAGLDNITNEVQSGHPVVLLGNGTLPASSYTGGHFITVSSYNPDTGKYTINDPTGKGPVEVTKDQLTSYGTGEASGGVMSGVAIERGDGQQIAPASGSGGGTTSVNGTGSTTTDPINSLPPNVNLSPPKTTSNVPDCTQEQCAEWVQRVFRENGKPLPVHGDAGSLFEQNWPAGYQKQSNSQPGLPPQAGDVLLWDENLSNGKTSDNYGHAALIQEVHPEGNPPYVLVAEANYGTNNGSTVPTRQIEYDPTTNTIKQTDSMTVQGWVHPEGENSLVNAQGGQQGNYIPGSSTGTPGTSTGTPGTSTGTPGTSTGTPGTSTGTPGTSTGTPGVTTQTGAPGEIPSWTPPGMNGNEGVSPGGNIMSPSGFEVNQETGTLLMTAWQDVMQGNFNSESIQKLYDWYMQGDKNSQDPMRNMAAGILQIAGMSVGQNTPAGTGLPPHLARRMQIINQF